MSEEPERGSEPAPAEAEPLPPGAAGPLGPAALAPAITAEALELRRAFRRRACFVLAVVVILVLGLDQWSKHWAHTTLRFEHAGRLSLVDGYLDLAYVRNPGAAWGFLARTEESFRQPFFIGISLVAMLFILYLFLRLEPGQRLLLYALALVMGGAVGNFVDRLRFRYVIDFIELHLRHRHRWPTFNVADMAITIGVLLLFAEMFLGSAWRRRRAGAAEPPPSER
jgi:signal peptidase II